MSKSKKQQRPRPPSASSPRAWRVQLWIGVGAIVALTAAWAGWRGRQASNSTSPTAALVSAAGSTSAAAPVSPSPSNSGPPGATVLSSNEVATAVMVTVELEFSGPIPSIREALRDVERRYKPDDGRGRTFAILDAYGEPTPAGKLHISMHISMEKPGLGELVFRRTGESLWKSRVVPAHKPTPTEKNLTVMMKDSQGRSAVLDGSQQVLQVLDVPLRDAGVLVRDRWPDGEECEFTFVYSSCGCPVKAKVRRVGEITVRSSDLPVMFPDDPAAMTVINQLMGWAAEP